MTTAPGDVMEEPVNDYDTFHAVLTSQIGKTRILFGAEIDCVDPESKSIPPSCYVELKTTKAVRSSREIERF